METLKERFKSLLAPVDEAEFFESYWQKHPVHIANNAAKGHAGLLRLGDVDGLLRRHGSDNDFDFGIVGAEGSHQNQEDSLSYQEIVDRFAEGKTLAITDLQTGHTRVRKLARVLEWALSAPVRVHAFVSPRRSQAFNRHQDPHDNFILQTDGRKRWTIYQDPLDRPVDDVMSPPIKRAGTDSPDILQTVVPSNGKDEEKREDVEPILDVQLQPGELLYVPRGFYHRVRTTGHPSVHLTASVRGFTWYDVALYALSRLVRRHGELRDYLPPGFTRDFATQNEVAERSRQVAELVRNQFNAEDLRGAFRLLTNHLLAHRNQSYRNHLTDVNAARSIELNDEVAIRPDITWHLRGGRERIGLLYDGNVLELPYRIKPVLNFIVEEERFQVGDLPSEFSRKSKKVLVRHLVHEGFLTFVDKQEAAAAREI